MGESLDLIRRTYFKLAQDYYRDSVHFDLFIIHGSTISAARNTRTSSWRSVVFVQHKARIFQNETDHSVF